MTPVPDWFYPIFGVAIVLLAIALLVCIVTMLIFTWRNR